MREYREKCNCNCECCASKQETCEVREDAHEAFAECLLEAADCAWMEVLKDKIKEHILATQNDKMSELAKIVSEGNSQRWRNKMEKKHSCMDFKEKLCNFFCKSKK
jgi:hypothetical protein